MLLVRKITYIFSLVLIFFIPWEDGVSTVNLGSLARLAGLVVAGCWLGTIVLEGKFRKPQLFHALVLLFFLWNFVSVFWSLNIENTFQRIKTYSQLFVLILIYWEIFQKPEELKAGLQAYIFGAYVLVISTIYNFLAGNVAVKYEGRYSATGVNAVDLALILMLGLPVAAHLFFAAQDGKQMTSLKALNLLYIPLSIFVVILTGSRTSLVMAIPFGIYILGARQIKFNRKLITFAVLFIFMLAFLPFVPQSVISRLGSIGSSISDGDLGGRIRLWWQAVVVLTEHPIVGVGSGAIITSIGSAVHNTFISIIAETGFVGFVLFLAILGTVVYTAANLPKEVSGLWLTMLMIWTIGVLSLSWEFRKLTWIILSFVIIEDNFQRQVFIQNAGVLSAEMRRLSESETYSAKSNLL